MINKFMVMLGIFFLFLPVVYSAEACPQRELNEVWNETITFLDAGNNPINTGACNLTTLYTNGTVDTNQECIKNPFDSIGVYVCNLTSHAPYGIYITYANCTLGADKASSYGCYESVNLTDRNNVTQNFINLLNPLGLFLGAFALIFIGINLKNRYTKYIQVAFILFALLWLTVGSSTISIIWSNSTATPATYGDPANSIGIYTVWIFFTLFVVMFLFNLLMDLRKAGGIK